MKKITIELTEEQLLFIRDKLHNQMRTDKEQAREKGREDGLGDAEILRSWRSIHKQYKEIELALWGGDNSE